MPEIELPDVSLYYTTRGSGPILLILQGGSGNADGSEALANELADRFTVVTHDRRGLSRSKPAKLESCDFATHAADAVRLIEAVSSEPPFVFGSSFGALVGMELISRHPDLVRRLIAHEPPAYGLLQGEEHEEAMRSHLEIREAARTEGIPAAMKRMLARSGVDPTDREPDLPPPAATSAQRLADLEHFFTWDVPAVTRYQPNVPAIQAARAKIVPAVGANSGTTRPYRCTIMLAEALGTTPVEFPGGHTGYMLRPKAYAARLGELFTS